jgi:hypothetical protein
MRMEVKRNKPGNYTITAPGQQWHIWKTYNPLRKGMKYMWQGTDTVQPGRTTDATSFAEIKQKIEHILAKKNSST